MPRWRKGRYAGKYKLMRRIGDGGFAVVYAAHDQVQDLDVALKLPLSDASESDLDDLEREVRIASSLVHPNILGIINADYVEKNVLAVAYPLGVGSVHNLIRRRALGPRKAMVIVEQVLMALAYAHRHGVIHCDVKPENLICFPKGHIKLGDFGLAKFARKTRKTSSTGGTLGYMAPEQAMGHPSPRTDVFSTGMLLYELLTGQLHEYPFDWPPSHIDRLRRKAPELIPVLRKALKPDPRHRYTDAGKMLDAFAAVQRRALKRLDRKR